MTSLKLHKFDMSSIKDHSIIVLIGKRGTGKSYLVRDFLYHKQDIPVGTVVSPTEKMNKYFSHFVPPIFIHEEYTPRLVSNVLKRQSDIIRKKQTGEYGEDVDERAFLIFDDCLFDDSWAKDKNMRCIFMNGRHYKLTFILTMQFPLGVKPHLRTNIDYVFILRENIVSNRRRIYEHYAGMFPTFDIFCKIMDQCTENYECLVIHNNAKSNKIEDQVFWYKAEMHDDFRLGSDNFWNYNNEYYDDESDGEDEVDLNTYGRKNKFHIDVKKIE